MFTMRIADLNICIDNNYSYVEDMCRDYFTSAVPDFTVRVSDNDIIKEMTSQNVSIPYCESLAIYRKIAEKIISQRGFLLHGVTIDFEGKGILFMAKSGVGKSTHAALWKKLFGEKITYVNGDKPLIRKINGRVYAYGTPWAGKENFHTNMRTEIKKLCFISRSDTNECIKLSKRQVLAPLMKQVYIPADTDNFLSLLSIISYMIERGEFYLIKCNTDIDSARVAYREIFDDKY